MFLCNIVTKSTKEDKAKLRRVLKYLKYIIDDKRTMGEDRISKLCTWVYYAYGSQPNLKSHTSGCMPFEYGKVHCKSRKQKLNTKISTKSEVVGVSDYLPYNICICLFMGAQVYDINRNIWFQDNQSEIKTKKWEEFMHWEI